MFRMSVELSDYDDCANQAVLQRFLDALSFVNRVYLYHHPDTPLLYESGVRYAPEDGSEEWCDIGECLRRGAVDCEDLACWRAAELQLSGVSAKAVAECEKQGKTKRLYHIIVRIVTANGTVRTEDPSMLLGMR